MHFRLIVILVSFLISCGCTSHTTQPSVTGPESAAASPALPTGTSSPAVESGAPSAPPAAGTAKPRFDACTLLTSQEIESVQGEAVKETKLTGQTSGGLSISQCFFTLPTFTNSVSVVVAQTGEGAGARETRDFWRDTFHRDKSAQREREGDRKEEEENEAGAPPQKISGLGEEAYWTGSRVGGSLHILKKDLYLRVSIGGPSDPASKMKKSKTLAQKALARL
jgi:hypothetical protein